METIKAVRIGQALAEADLIIIGASNGLDMAEGLNLFYADAHFQEAYGDLAQADGIGCILQGLTSPDANVRRRWADRFHQKEYVEYEPGPIMNGLRHLTEHADTFVITCNIDGHFARAGFNENHVLETEGKRMLARVANACEHATYIVFNYSQALTPDASCETILVDGDMTPAFEEIVRCHL